MTIPAAEQRALADRLEQHRREHLPGLTRLAVRYRGDHAYVAHELDDGGSEPLFRLTWRGSQDDWGIALWSGDRRGYVDATPPNGDTAGTPEEALRRACDSGLDQPAGKRQATRWSLPPPSPPEGGHVIRPYVRAMRRHPLVVVLVILGAVLGSVAIVATRSSTYTAQARLLVTPVERGEAGDLGLPLLQEHGEPTRTIETAAALVENRTIAAATADAFGGTWTADDVLGAIDVNPMGQTNVLEVRATADDADTAAALANSYADAVVRVRDDALRERADAAIATIQADLADSDTMSSSTVRTLESRLSELELLRLTGDPTVAVAEAAEVPTSADGSSTVVVVIAALLLGLLLAPGAAFAVDLLGPRRLVGEDELVEVYPLAILARVGHQRELGTSAATDPAVRDAFRRLCAQIELASPRPRTIMITSPAGDDGRAWAALNLAAELTADQTTGVVLIDLDGELVLDAAEGTFAGEAGEVAGFSRHRLADRTSLLVLGGDLEGWASDRVVSAALEAIRLNDDADYVVLHAPPLAEMTDVLRLAATADALILVVRLGSTTRGDLEAARQQLASIGVPPTGYVVIG